MVVSPDHTPNSALSEHLVQFYEADGFLLNSLCTFMLSGLRTGEACLVVATQAHHEGLLQRLEEHGIDVGAIQMRGEYLWLDAAEVLQQFMVDGLPEPERFTEVVGRVIAQAATCQRRVRIFGEMVALLWMQGNQAGALRLEELWNDLHHQFPAFSLLCAYPMHGFDGSAYQTSLHDICQQHSHTIPAESYNLLANPDEQARAITLLQQQANSLEAEIAERKEVEQLLRLSEEEHARLAAIVESSDDAIVSKTLDGIITSWNGAAEQLFGYSAQEAVGKHITLIIPAELFREEEEIIAKLRQGIRIQHFETVRLRKDGSRIEVSLSISPIKDRSGKIIGAAKIARDISGRRELERRKDEFISMASHELKTPVTVLKGFTQLLLRRFQSRQDDGSLHILVRMDSQINKLTKHISEMLDLSRMQNGQLAYHMECFDLAELVQEMLENVQESTETHQLLLEESAVAHICGDRDRVGQVLINLLTNAIKYSRDADRVIVRLRTHEGSALVSVLDFGIGISGAYHEKIFERFYQVSEPAEKTYPGLGIGLYIARQIVERHYGRLWVESCQGEGSTFSFQLPLARNES